MTWRKASSDISLVFLSFTVQDIPLTNMLAPGAFLVRRRDQSERSPKSKNETNELAHRGHSRGSHLQTSIAEDQLQQRRVLCIPQIPSATNALEINDMQEGNWNLG
jgi:hypothetical protein